MAHIPRVLCTEGLSPGAEISLPAERAHHLYTVLRKRPGDSVRAWDGAHREADAVIQNISHKAAAIVVGATVENINRESPLNLVLVQAIGRGDRFESALTAAIEIGAWAIQPVWTEFGLPALKSERLAKKQRSWEQQTLGAAEQAERTALPQILAATDLRSWLAVPRHGVVLHPGEDVFPSTLAEVAPREAFHVVVGPEGGFSPTEIKLAKASGLKLCALGPRILRTEHAGAVALSLLQALAGDFRPGITRRGGGS